MVGVISLAKKASATRGGLFYFLKMFVSQPLPSHFFSEQQSFFFLCFKDLIKELPAKITAHRMIVAIINFSISTSFLFSTCP